MAELSDEDAKLVKLAQGARARIQAVQGAALRDETGRTYSGANVALPNLNLTALQLTVAQALAAGASGIECAVVVDADGRVAPADLAAIVDLGGDLVPIILCDLTGTVVVQGTVVVRGISGEAELRSR